KVGCRRDFSQASEQCRLARYQSALRTESLLPALAALGGFPAEVQARTTLASGNSPAQAVHQASTLRRPALLHSGHRPTSHSLSAEPGRRELPRYRRASRSRTRRPAPTEAFLSRRRSRGLIRCRSWPALVHRAQGKAQGACTCRV